MRNSLPSSSPMPIPGPPASGSGGVVPLRRGSATKRLRAEEPGDLLAVLPYLIGYHPEESLVMAVIRGRTIEVCVRIDLDADPLESAERFGEIARQNSASGVVLVAYSGDSERADRLLDPVVLGLDEIGVIDAIHTDGRRWWSRLCANPDCCPPEGVPYEIDTSRLAAEAVFAGMTTYADRSELSRQVQGPEAAGLDDLEDLAVRISIEVLEQPVRDRQRWLRGFVEEYVRRRSRSRRVELADEHLVRLACLTIDVAVRDEAWAMITREHAWIHVELWQQVVSRSVPSLAPGPLCLLGTAAWVAGQGTLQVCCLERVRDIEPTYSMANILEDINLRALPPAYWDELQASLEETLAEQRGRRTCGRGIPEWSMPWGARSRCDKRRSSRASRRRSARKE